METLDKVDQGGVSEEGLSLSHSSRLKRRIRLALVFSAVFSLSSCDDISSSSPVSSSIFNPKEANSKTEEKTSESILKTGKAKFLFSKEFLKELKGDEISEGFFLPETYRWDLSSKIMKKTGQKSIDSSEFDQMDHAVIAEALRRELDDWANLDLNNRTYNLFWNGYPQSLFRQYKNLRFLEVFPDSIPEGSDNDLDQLLSLWNKSDAKAQKLTMNSPFFNSHKGKKLSEGLYDGQISSSIDKMYKEILSHISVEKNPQFKFMYYNRVRLSVLDAHLPAIYFIAIKDQLKKAGISESDAGFNREDIEASIKKAFKERSELFRKSGRVKLGMQNERWIFELMKRKFSFLSQSEHPLE